MTNEQNFVWSTMRTMSHGWHSHFWQQQKRTWHLVTQCFQKLQSTGVTLNRAKCKFGKEHLIFWGQNDGISADPSKTRAIMSMCRPRTTTEFRTFLGMVNQLREFTPRAAELTSSLCELLSTKNICDWIYENRSKLHKNWNPFYYLTLKLHTSTTQAHG